MSYKCSLFLEQHIYKCTLILGQPILSITYMVADGTSSTDKKFNMAASGTVTPYNNCNTVASSNINSENVIDMAAISASEAEIDPNLRKEMDLIQHLLI